MSILRKIFGNGPGEPESEAKKLVGVYLKGDFTQHGYFSEHAAREKAEHGQILALDPSQQSESLLEVLRALHTIETGQKNWHKLPTEKRCTSGAARALASDLMRRKLPFTPEQFAELCRSIQAVMPQAWPDPRVYFVATVDRYKKDGGGFTPEHLTLLCEIQRQWRAESGDIGKRANKLGELIGSADEPPPLPVFRNGEVFASQALDDLEGMDGPRRNAWSFLLSHAAISSGSKPSKSWEKQARERVTKVGEAEFIQRLRSWLPLIDQPCPLEREQRYEGSNYVYRFHPLQICDPHLDLLKGMVWMAGLIDDDDLTRTVGAVGISAYKKLPGIGPRATRVGNACVWALGNIASSSALTQLAVMKVRVKFGSAQQAIGKALGTLASAIGVSTEELEEMSVPAYGLTEVGRLEESMGEFTAVLEVIDGKAVLQFRKPDGKLQKAVPASVKEEFAEDLKELKSAAKDLEKMLIAQKERLDGLFLLRKSWPLEQWRERYLDHPVVGILARKLIWRFTGGTDGRTMDAIWFDGALRDFDRQPVDPPDGSTVTPWHPIDSTTADIVRWRNWLFEHLIRQPFKQAHREIYLLTDAEHTTATYSNRFASHILKQHQFNSLCAVRGWKNRLRLMVDDSYPPATRLLPEWGLRAEYWIEGMGTDYNDEYVTESGAFRYLVTDQVRFYPIDAGQATAHAGGGGYGPGWRQTLAEPLALDTIPPLVLSEVLRDVDLFVGVTSAGNDPNWSDGGPQGRHADYWQEYSFGDLGESAELRKQLLGSLLPRLKIAGQCRLDGRFLVVEGKLRTYKIHLGSGNILMEPDDRYLCIVKAPTGGKDGEVFLPFEGDGKLATILSKAFLLADDRKISDPTILSQIKR